MKAIGLSKDLGLSRHHYTDLASFWSRLSTKFQAKTGLQPAQLLPEYRTICEAQKCLLCPMKMHYVIDGHATAVFWPLRDRLRQLMNTPKEVTELV